MKADGARFILAAILALFGSFAAWPNVQYLTNGQDCAGCDADGPSSNIEAGLGLFMGLLLVWGALRLLRPGVQPSGCMLWLAVAACVVYIVRTVYGPSGLNIQLQADNRTLNLTVAVIGLLYSLNALRRRG